MQLWQRTIYDVTRKISRPIFIKLICIQFSIINIPNAKQQNIISKNVNDQMLKS